MFKTIEVAVTVMTYLEQRDQLAFTIVQIQKQSFDDVS